MLQTGRIYKENTPYHSGLEFLTSCRSASHLSAAASVVKGWLCNRHRQRMLRYSSTLAAFEIFFSSLRNQFVKINKYGLKLTLRAVWGGITSDSLDPLAGSILPGFALQYPTCKTLCLV